MKRLVITILMVAFALTPLSVEARKYSRSYSGFGKSHSIFNQKTVKKKSAVKSIFEPRPKFRKTTTENAIKNAGKNPDGSMACPTCEKRMTGEKVSGKRDFDLDHHPATWAERKKRMKALSPQPDRKTVRDEYQKDVRVQCPDCNRSHKFEEKPDEQ